MNWQQDGNFLLDKLTLPSGRQLRRTGEERDPWQHHELCCSCRSPITVRIMPTLCRSLADGQESTLIVAHRGASRYAPDNSVAAVELAIAQGADMVEIDIRRTEDGVLVAHHDPSIHGAPLASMQYDAVRVAVPEIAPLDELL